MTSEIGTVCTGGLGCERLQQVQDTSSYNDKVFNEVLPDGMKMYIDMAAAYGGIQRWQNFVTQ